MMRKSPNLIRDERGASIVEMGLAAPLLATFLLGMVDLGGAYSAKLRVEQAAVETERFDLCTYWRRSGAGRYFGSPRSRKRPSARSKWSNVTASRTASRRR